MGELSEVVSRRAAAITSQTTSRAAADVMHDELRRAAAAVLGADLRLSRMPQAGPARIEGRATVGEARVEVSGAAYTIADKGRRTIRRAEGPVSTPWGVRASVAGSTSAGKDISGRAAQAMFDAAARAVPDSIDRQVG